jgi:HPt (histidine-containing phosphotransfer) domain-containing protein
LSGELHRITGSGEREPAPPTLPVVAEKPQHADWDLKNLMERLDGDQEFLRELLVIFRQDVEVNLQKSRDAIGKHDLDGLSRAAHTIKGMLKNLSMGPAAESAAALEQSARENLPEKSQELLSQLSKELEEILPQVESQLREVRP